MPAPLPAQRSAIRDSFGGVSPPNSPDPLLDLPVAAPDGVSDASHQLRALAALSGSLTDPLTPEEASAIVERHALAALGATSAVVVTFGDFPHNEMGESSPAPSAGDTEPTAADELTLIHAIGVPDVAFMPTPLRLDAAVPLAEVARTGQAVFLNAEAELRRYPGWGEQVQKAGTRAAAAVPVWANGQLRGVLGLTWNKPRAFDRDERAFVITLGVMCAQAIMRGHLVAAERRAREAVEQAIKAQAQFLRTMTHELRTPLGAVVGYTHLLSEDMAGLVTPEQKDHLRRARRASEHVLSLVDVLLSYARIESGETRVSVEHVLAADVVEEALDIVRPIAALKGVRIRVEIPDPTIALQTDPLKLRQILVNLVTNAVKYTDVGSVVLIVRVEGLGTALTVFFEVTDTGRGIATADHEHIFEAFWQAAHPLRRESDGTGLGLAVARQLARLLGGDVVIAQSEPGRGSTFIASLPAQFPGGGNFTPTERRSTSAEMPRE